MINVKATSEVAKYKDSKRGLNQVDHQYLTLCGNILANGHRREERTGTGAISIFGAQIKVNLADGFPILTTKKIHFTSVVGELLWFLRGESNVQFLRDHGIKIWDAWADKNGEVGPMYGVQWRKWSRGEERLKPVDQIATLIKGLISDPNSRRHVVSAWNVDRLPHDSVATPQGNASIGNMALAPCHYSFQCYVENGKLSMLVNQRSADVFLGLPFNLASYALLTHMLAQVCDLEVGNLIWSGGDCHIYNNHISQIEEQMRRGSQGDMYRLPRLELNKDVPNIDGFSFYDIALDGYVSGAKLTGEVAV